MPKKRTATVAEHADRLGASFKLSRNLAGRSCREANVDPDNDVGEYEDPWEDEQESDEEVVDSENLSGNDNEDAEDGMLIATLHIQVLLH